MPDLLVACPLTMEQAREVPALNCGDAYLSTWVQGEGASLLADLARRLRIWLFFNQPGKLVGYGSLGVALWNFPTRKSSRVPVNIIPAVAVQREYWGLPSGAGEKTYAQQIIEFLIEQAVQVSEVAPALGLYVDPANARAIRLYVRNQFEILKHQVLNDRQTGIRFQGMVRKLARPE